MKQPTFSTAPRITTLPELVKLLGDPAHSLSATSDKMQGVLSICIEFDDTQSYEVRLLLRNLEYESPTLLVSADLFYIKQHFCCTEEGYVGTVQFEVDSELFISYISQVHANC